MSGEIVASGVDRTEGPRDFAYEVAWEAEQYCMRFKAYLICSIPLEGHPGGPSFRRKGSDWMDWTENHAEAQPAVDGWIKWDGCSDITFDDTHLCGASSFVQYIRMMAWIHAKAAAVIPHWDDDTIRLDVDVIEGKP